MKPTFCSLALAAEEDMGLLIPAEEAAATWPNLISLLLRDSHIRLLSEPVEPVAILQPVLEETEERLLLRATQLTEEKALLAATEALAELAAAVPSEEMEIMEAVVEASKVSEEMAEHTEAAEAAAEQQAVPVAKIPMEEPAELMEEMAAEDQWLM